ncbi:hypothetical protein AB6C98_01300 [Vibrio splendidus]
MKDMNRQHKVLVICKETYSYPMMFAIKDLISRGYDVEVLYIHSTEVILKDPSYTHVVSNLAEIKVHTFVDEFDTFILNRLNVKKYIDMEYLQLIEEKYCEDINLSLLQVSAQIFTTPYHYRFFFRDMTENERLYWIQLIFKKIEKIVKKINFDSVFDIDIAEFGRSALHQVTKKHGIPYVTIEHSRYNNYLLPTFNLGRRTDDYFIQKYKDNYLSDEVDDYIKLVDEFNFQDSLMLDSYKSNNTSKVKARPLYKDIRKLGGMLKYLSTTLVSWYPYRHAPPFGNPIKAMLFFVKNLFKERYLLGKRNQVFANIEPGEEYVYFPLHLIPESTTLNKSPFYPNEIAVIEAVSKSLPVGWLLYVKEHGAMIGERPLHFYRSINRLSNVKLVRLDAYHDPKPWILKSKGVITLSGTSAFEASMCNKPSIIFGNAFYDVMSNVIKVSSFEELPKKIRNFENYKFQDKKSQASYLKTIIENGKKINILSLLIDSENVAKNGGKLTKENQVNITYLVDLFVGSFHLNDHIN